MTTDNKPVIFISHVAANRQWAREMSKALRDRGALTSADWDIRAGEDVSKSLRKKITDCDGVVALIDRDDLRSPWVFFELGAAVSAGKRLFPVVSRELKRNELPVVFKDFQWYTKDEGAGRIAAQIVLGFDTAHKRIRHSSHRGLVRNSRMRDKA